LCNTQKFFVTEPTQRGRHTSKLIWTRPLEYTIIWNTNGQQQHLHVQTTSMRSNT